MVSSNSENVEGDKSCLYLSSVQRPVLKFDVRGSCFYEHIGQDDDNDNDNEMFMFMNISFHGMMIIIIMKC